MFTPPPMHFSIYMVILLTRLFDFFFLNNILDIHIFCKKKIKAAANMNAHKLSDRKTYARMNSDEKGYFKRHDFL